jgi:hypothetical protein
LSNGSGTGRLLGGIGREGPHPAAAQHGQAVYRFRVQLKKLFVRFLFYFI